MKFILPMVVCVVLLAGIFSSCKKNPVSPKQDTTKCDTCGKDTAHCDTCKHDTIPTTSDTTSHNFTWTESTIPGEAGLTGCWVFGPNDIYVVGGSLYKSTDGKNWTLINLTDADRGYSLNGIISGVSMFAFTESDFWLTNGFPIHVTSGGVAKQYRVDTGSWAGPLHSSWGTSSSDMYTVGDGGTILHFDGANWTKMQSGTTYNITDIWGTSDQNIWAAGYHQSTNSSVLLHFNGGSWTPINLNLLGTNTIWHGIEGAWTCDSASHHKAYACGSLLYRNSDNSNIWSNDSGKLANAAAGGFDPLNFIRGNGANDFMVEGGSGFVSHWNGISWYFYQSMYDYNDISFDTYAFSFVGNTACQVGHKNGSGWVAVGQR